MLSSAASRPSPARMEIPRKRRRAPVRNRTRNLFDLVPDETIPWETLDEEQKNLAIQILARLIAQALLSAPERGKNDE
jgi:hypothetical protein